LPELVSARAAAICQFLGTPRRQRPSPPVAVPGQYQGNPRPLRSGFRL